MSPAIAIPFFTILCLGPIPAWHFLLHANLPAWRKNPGAYYSMAAVVWALFVPLAWHLAQSSPLLFEPSRATRALGLGASGASFLVAMWSMLTLTPRRFFMWAVLRPEECPAERILRGPYRVTSHPTYVAMVTATASNFLAGGSAVLLGMIPVLGALLVAVAVLEQRELDARLAPALPERELADPPLSPSTRH
jgi:protein-S-isoprenylcysteine O-methyltransferase Ste14